MEIADQIAAARDQLTRTLTFFQRVDAKASVVLGVDTGLLAVLATRAAQPAALRWEWVPIGLTMLFLAVSFWHLYQQSFPSLDGGGESLLYFQEVAKRTEARYIESWKAMSSEQYVNDLLGQVWRNSEILRKKYDHLKWALYSMSLAMIPWAVSLALLTLRSAHP